MSLTKINWFALCLYLFSIHFEKWDPLNTGIDFLVTKVTIMFYLFTSLAVSKYAFSISRFRKILLPLIAFYVLNIIIGYFNKRPGYSDYFSLPFLLYITVFITMLNHSSRERNIMLDGLNAFALGGVILTLFFTFGINTFSFGDRVGVFKENLNAQSLNISIAIIIIIYNVAANRYSKLVNVLIVFIIIPFMLFFMAGTGSRTGFISLLVGVAVFFILRKSKNNFRSILSITIGIVVVQLIWSFFLSNIIIGNRITEALKYYDLSGRENRWEVAFEMFLAKPLFGNGNTGYTYETTMIFGQYASSHNEILAILAMSGISGFILFVIFFREIHILSIRILKTERDASPLVLIIPIWAMIGAGHLWGTKIAYGIFAYIVGKAYHLYIKHNSLLNSKHQVINNQNAKV